MVVELGSVPGFVVFDLPDAVVSAGGTRLAPDVSVAEVALLARAMTYKFAVLGAQVGGAKAGLRGDPADLAGKAALMARFCAEVGPLVDSGRFLTGPDMGTAEEDFAPLRERQASPAAIQAVVGGVPFEDLLTGYGVTVAAEAALAADSGWGWDGRGAAIGGFGKGAAGWRTRSSAAAAGWWRCPPSPGVSRTRQGWTSSCCSRCAGRTAMRASPA